jgi:hypothetical protein
MPDARAYYTSAYYTSAYYTGANDTIANDARTSDTIANYAWTNDGGFIGSFWWYTIRWHTSRRIKHNVICRCCGRYCRSRALFLLI